MTTLTRFISEAPQFVRTGTREMQRAYFGVIDKNMERVQRDALFGRHESAKEAYRAMLAAAPEPRGKGK